MTLTERRDNHGSKTEYLPTAELNALAVESKTDEAAALRLWYEVERFADWVADKYSRRNSSVLTEDDYKQCAYIGFAKAVRYFDTDKNNFLSSLNYAVRSECWREYQRMCVKIVDTVSYDVPSRSESSDTGNAMIDFLPDDTAVSYYSHSPSSRHTRNP